MGFKTKLKRPDKKPEKLPNFFPPTNDEKTAFNIEFRKNWHNKIKNSAALSITCGDDAIAASASSPPSCGFGSSYGQHTATISVLTQNDNTGHTTEAIKEAATSTLTKILANIKKPHLTIETVRLMADRQKARDDGCWEKEKYFNKQVKHIGPKRQKGAYYCQFGKKKMARL